jgi:hypothetical protein
VISKYSGVEAPHSPRSSRGMVNRPLELAIVVVEHMSLQVEETRQKSRIHVIICWTTALSFEECQDEIKLIGTLEEAVQERALTCLGGAKLGASCEG